MGVGAPGQAAYCFACGRAIDPRAEICPGCGVRQRSAPTVQYPDPNLYGRSRVVAALLAIFLGGLGVHKFYLGKIGQGVVYLLFCWTLIPSTVAFFEGIWYLTLSDPDFWSRYPSEVQRAAWASASPPSTMLPPGPGPAWSAPAAPVVPPVSAAWGTPGANRCSTCGQMAPVGMSFCSTCGSALPTS